MNDLSRVIQNKNISKFVFFKGQSTFNSKYNPIKKEIIDYVMNSQKPNLPELSSIIKKYSPDTDIIDISSSNSMNPAEFRQHLETVEQHPKEYRIRRRKKEILLSPRLDILPRVDSRNIKNINNKLELTDTLLHEITHLFHEESCDRISSIDMINSYLRQEKNIERAENTLQCMRYLNEYLRENCQKVASFNKTESIIISPVPESFLDINKNFIALFGRPAVDCIQNVISNTFRKFPSNSIDKKFILKYLRFEAKREQEAYTNGANSGKEFLGINSSVDRELYAHCAKLIVAACEKLLQRYPK